jgi:hypothetical protein
MDSSNGNGMYMPVAPAYMGGGYGNGGFGFGGDGWWVILFLFALMGNGFGGWGGFGGAGNMMLGYDFPWLMNGQNGINQNTNSGFRDAMLNDGITSIRDGISGISTQLCNGFAGVNAGVANGFAQAEIADNARQMANMQSMFNVQSALQNCCCENRSNIADLKYTVATENCADRQALNEGVRDIISNSTAQTQAILDKLCALELDGYKRENDQLRSQLNMATLRESQTAQNAFIQQGFSDEVDQLYNRLNNCPVPSTPVYGRTPIFTCNNNGYGCSCGAM